MLWRYIPGDPDADDAVDELGHMDKVVITDMEGEDVGLGYLSDVATWYADNDVRHGYDVRIRGGAFKGPYAIIWGRIEIAFEECGMVARLREHLLSIWGAEGVHLGTIGDRRLDRID
jgi:hypothetical protein